jgi:hypothetical protein
MCLTVDTNVKTTIHSNHMGESYTIAYKLVRHTYQSWFRHTSYNSYEVKSNRKKKGVSSHTVNKGIHVYLDYADAFTIIFNSSQYMLLPVICYHKDLVATGKNHDYTSRGAVYMKVYTQLL